MRSLVLLGLILISFGCTRSPESLCEHVTKLVERQFGPTDPNDKEGSHDKSVQHCTKVWTEKKAKDPKAYECYVDCADRTKNMVDLAECQPKCYPHEALPRDETENLQGWFEAASASAKPSAAPVASTLPAASISAAPSTSAVPSASAAPSASAPAKPSASTSAKK